MTEAEEIKKELGLKGENNDLEYLRIMKRIHDNMLEIDRILEQNNPEKKHCLFKSINNRR